MLKKNVAMEKFHSSFHSGGEIKRQQALSFNIELGVCGFKYLLYIRKTKTLNWFMWLSKKYSHKCWHVTRRFI